VLQQTSPVKLPCQRGFSANAARQKRGTPSYRWKRRWHIGYRTLHNTKTSATFSPLQGRKENRSTSADGRETHQGGLSIHPHITPTFLLLLVIRNDRDSLSLAARPAPPLMSTALQKRHQLRQVSGLQPPEMPSFIRNPAPAAPGPEADSFFSCA